MTKTERYWDTTAQMWRSRQVSDGEQTREEAAAVIDEMKNGTFKELLAVTKELQRVNADNARLAAERDEMREALEAYQQAYEPYGTHECFATGPLTGDPIQDLFVCPACVAGEKAKAALGRSA